MKKLLYFLILITILQQQSCGQISKETQEDIDKAVEYFNQQNYEQALFYAEKLLQKKSRNYVLWTMKGRCLFNLNKQKEGLKAINKAIEINPKYYEAYAYRAVMYNLLGTYKMEEIISELDKLLTHEPENIEIRIIKAGIYLKYNTLDKALIEYNKILKAQPDNYKVMASRGVVYRRLGKYNLALEDYNKASESKDKLTIELVLDGRGYLFIKMKLYKKAIKDFTELIEKYSEEIPIDFKAYSFNNRGFAYHKMGNNEKALEDINYSLKLYPENSYAYKNRALVYLDIGKNKEACKELDRALKLGYTQQYGNEVEELVETNCK